MSDFEALVEKAAAAMIHLRRPETERVQPGDRQVARAALDAIGLPALLERVEAAEGALGHWQRVSREREGCICPSGPSYEGPQEDCSQHGRPYSYWVERADNLGSQVDALAAKVARVEALAELWAKPFPNSNGTSKMFATALRVALTEGEKP